MIRIMSAMESSGTSAGATMSGFLMILLVEIRYACVQILQSAQPLKEQKLWHRIKISTDRFLRFVSPICRIGYEAPRPRESPVFGPGLSYLTGKVGSVTSAAYKGPHFIVPFSWALGPS
jgi:hypothetical protein